MGLKMLNLGWVVVIITHVILSFKRWKQEDHKFKASLCYIVRPLIKKIARISTSLLI
jgi:hypothetical protein